MCKIKRDASASNQSPGETTGNMEERGNGKIILKNFGHMDAVSQEVQESPNPMKKANLCGEGMGRVTQWEGRLLTLHRARNSTRSAPSTSCGDAQLRSQNVGDGGDRI